MGYRKIPNLYKDKDILMFKEVYALEKVHGTSTHVTYTSDKLTDKLSFFSGGCNYEHFLKSFDHDSLLDNFRKNAELYPYTKTITVYGEGYGGKLQGMSSTYGKETCFIAFEAKVDDRWLSVTEAENLATKLGLEFVPYTLIKVTEENINKEMIADSVVAIRRGMGSGHMREGIVLRPKVELVYQDGGRIICKHKRPEFAEREHTPRFDDSEELKILEDAKAIAQEWCTAMRLTHVLDKFTDPTMKDMDKIIKAMIADIYTEAHGEIKESKAVAKAIGKQTAKLFRQYLENFNGV
jgi:hypothetical protein